MARKTDAQRLEFHSRQVALIKAKARAKQARGLIIIGARLVGAAKRDAGWAATLEKLIAYEPLSEHDAAAVEAARDR